MATSATDRLQRGRQLIDQFAERTGLTKEGGDPQRRYLWTDALAVQTCFGLARARDESAYRALALRLIDRVHETLGRHHPQDDRTGWISGLPDEQAREHPTAAGLRIGKPAPERPADAPLDQRLEWDRDGQYFHYLTRWCQALLRAGDETGEEKYGRWAAELMLAGQQFIDRRDGHIQLYWKMSIDLSRPQVPSQGAHDPLEGLLCCLSARRAAPVLAAELDPLIEDLTQLCAGRHWATSDALGIGGLLLNAGRAAELEQANIDLPASVASTRLWGDSLQSLRNFATQHHHDTPASHRLAFRECGLSLGVRALHTAPALPEARPQLAAFLPLASDLEAYWLEPRHQRVPTWMDHLDINAVTLAASLAAGEVGRVFT